MRLDALQSNKQYDLIYSDPPWKQTKGGLRKCRPNQTRALDYNTLSLDDIKEYHRKAMTLCVDNHNCFMWTIDKFLFAAEQIMTELGYKLHARFIWDKENGIAPAFTVRFSHEYLLWFYKGKMIPIDKEQRGKFTTVLRERATVHSKKPICAYELIEKLYPDAVRLEMYARNERKGFDCWGNEV